MLSSLEILRKIPVKPEMFLCTESLVRDLINASRDFWTPEAPKCLHRKKGRKEIKSVDFRDRICYNACT